MHHYGSRMLSPMVYVMRRLPAHMWPVAREQMRIQVAANFDMNPDRICHANLDKPTKIRFTGYDWQIYYRDEWRLLFGYAFHRWAGVRLDQYIRNPSFAA